MVVSSCSAIFAVVFFMMQIQIVCKASGSLLCQVHGGWRDVTCAVLSTGCTTMENILKMLFGFEDLYC